MSSLQPLRRGCRCGDVQSRSIQTITLCDGDVLAVTGSEDSAIRIDVLQRLAEQAMSDPAFRADASKDLPAALQKYGYDLTSQELALVLRFRRSLADAGVDLDLVAGMGEDQLADLFASLQRRFQGAG